MSSSKPLLIQAYEWVKANWDGEDGLCCIEKQFACEQAWVSGYKAARKELRAAVEMSPVRDTAQVSATRDATAVKPLEQRQAEWDAMYKGDGGMGQFSIMYGPGSIPPRPTE